MSIINVNPNQHLEIFLKWKKDVDSENLLDAFDLALGYFSGLGYSHIEACNLASDARDYFN